MGEECAQTLTEGRQEEAERIEDSPERIMALVDWLFLGDEGKAALPS